MQMIRVPMTCPGPDHRHLDGASGHSPLWTRRFQATRMEAVWRPHRLRLGPDAVRNRDSGPVQWNSSGPRTVSQPARRHMRYIDTSLDLAFEKSPAEINSIVDSPRSKAPKSIMVSSVASWSVSQAGLSLALSADPSCPGPTESTAYHNGDAITMNAAHVRALASAHTSTCRRGSLRTRWLSRRRDAQAAGRQGWSGDIAAQFFEAQPVVGSYPGGRVRFPPGSPIPIRRTKASQSCRCTVSVLALETVIFSRILRKRISL